MNPSCLPSNSDQSASYEELLDAAAVVSIRRPAREAAVGLRTTMTDLEEVSVDGTTASVTPELESISSLKEERRKTVKASLNEKKQTCFHSPLVVALKEQFHILENI